MINCKDNFSLKWIENCVLTTAAINADTNTTGGAHGATFEITDAKPYVPIVTLSAEDNAKLSKLFSEGFKRSIYWNKYKVITNIFFPRAQIENYNIEIEGKNFYDQWINNSIKQYDEVRKVSTGQGDDYTTGCLLYFAYFEKKIQINCCWFKQKKTLDADSRVMQQIIFTGKIKATETNTRVTIYYILEQSKETILEFAKGTTKVL